MMMDPTGELARVSITMIEHASRVLCVSPLVLLVALFEPKALEELPASEAERGDDLA